MRVLVLTAYKDAKGAIELAEWVSISLVHSDINTLRKQSRLQLRTGCKILGRGEAKMDGEADTW